MFFLHAGTTQIEKWFPLLSVGNLFAESLFSQNKVTLKTNVPESI